MSSKLILCTFIVSIFANQHCHFKYHSYHVGEDFRESRKNFTTELRQNCGEGNFEFKIMLKNVWNSSEIEDLRVSFGIYLDKLLDHRPDLKTSVDINEINFDEIEIDHEAFTKAEVKGACMERVKREMRCQINLVFVIDSFRTKDLMKFKGESAEEVEGLTLALHPEIVDWDNLHNSDLMMNEIKQGETEIPMLVEEITEDFMYRD